MDRYSYTLNREGLDQKAPGKKYYKRDLELMTTHQLRELCRREKIIQGVIDPMDKDDLIRVILRYRGADENQLIRTPDENGMNALCEMMKTVRIEFCTDITPRCSAKLTAFQGVAITPYDRMTIGYHTCFSGTNALIVSANHEVCGILNVESYGGDRENLYLTKAADIPFSESDIKNYSLYCFDHANSALLYRVYCGEYSYLPENLKAYRVPLLDFSVREPVALDMPLAIDFGTSNTTAGIYLDSLYFERTGDFAQRQGLKENSINYALFTDIVNGRKETALFPSVVGVLSVEDGVPQYVFGYEAVQLANSSYIDEGFCVFYDIKRWVEDYTKTEEIIDRQGHCIYVERKEIIRAYLDYIIRQARDRFKCNIHMLHISCPVKQKYQFQKLFQEIFPDYVMAEEDMLDEGVSVLYNTISEMLDSKTAVDGKEYKALLIDCGGGTTDLCSCTFQVRNRRVSYQIDIETAYENGDTDFGGNNLTYRIMQLLKISLVPHFQDIGLKSVHNLLAGFDMDIFRFVDENGTDKVYESLEEEYRKAEAVIPTRFKEYELRSRADYYKVKNNFYFLFDTAERIKKEFFNKIGTLRVALSSTTQNEDAVTCMQVDKWKLSVNDGKGLAVVKEFPRICFSVLDINLLLKADVYGVMRKFLEGMYNSGELFEFSIIKLTGQSCKIGLFRDALKEYVPGKVVQTRRQAGDISNDFALKMACIDGALKYIQDKKYGFADITIKNRIPALPYIISAYTHTGAETVLIRSFERGGRTGQISRSIENLTLKLYLKSLEGSQHHSYTYTYSCTLEEFAPMLYEQIHDQFDSRILQADTDSIIDREVRFFVWAEPVKWGFVVIPVYRTKTEIMVGKEQFFSFENDNWVQNFFDGTK